MINLMPWREALDSQLLTLQSIEKLVSTVEQRGINAPMSTTTLLSAWRTDIEMLKLAEPFYWSKETMNSALAASASLPGDSDFSMINVALPELCTVWWRFEEPLQIRTLDDDTRLIEALCFGWAALRTSPRDAEGFVRPQHTSLVVTAFTAPTKDGHRVLPGLVPTQVFNWNHGLTLAGMMTHVHKEHQRKYGPGGQWSKLPSISVDRFMAATEQLARFVLAACAWLSQTVLQTSEGHIERHRRKEAARTLATPVEHVRVVHLRKSVHTGTGAVEDHDTSTNVNWHSRWVVDGHWRNQACGPKHGERRLTWVHPYIKGPDDKPLSDKRPRVFVVNR